MFVGREEELKELRELYATNDIEIISVLGRRRVGKSQLIFQSYDNFDGLVLSFECGDVGYKDNLDALTKYIRETFNNDYLFFSSLFDILIFLEKEAIHQKILFVLDEYPYIRKGKETDSEIKNAIDAFNTLEKENPFKFILCGSSVEIMEVLDDVNMPLHGRFNKIIHLYPLNYLESSLFYKNASNEDKIKYYSSFGGVPYYLEQIDSTKSFDENIVRLYFANNALLKNELENQVFGEINKVEKASYILNIIRKRTISYSDILSKFRSSFPEGNVDYALSKLQKMHVIEKIYVEQDNGKRKPYYRLLDNSLIFYYSYLIQPFANRLIFKDSEYYETFVKQDFEELYVPIMFEKIGYEFIALMNKNGKLPFKLIDLFPYVINDPKLKANYQFDVVGKTKEGLINFECKFQENEITKEEVDKELSQTFSSNKDFYKVFFISKSKVNANINTYYLEDVFSDDLI